jgi:hypothetical protein
MRITSSFRKMDNRDERRGDPTKRTDTSSSALIITHRKQEEKKRVEQELKARTKHGSM